MAIPAAGPSPLPSVSAAGLSSTFESTSAAGMGTESQDSFGSRVSKGFVVTSWHSEPQQPLPGQADPQILVTMALFLKEWA